MWLLKVLLAGVLLILEVFMLPWILLATPLKAKRLRWLDMWFGNFVDGTGWNYRGYWERQLEDGEDDWMDTANISAKELGNWERITMDGFTGWVGKRYPRYAWLQLRNPVNQFLRNAGPNGVVQKIRRYGQYITLAKIGGRWWWLFRLKIYYGPTLRFLDIKLGYKFFDDPRTSSVFREGRSFQNSLAVSFQPWRKEKI